MVLGSGLAHLGGYPFEVRYSDGSLVRARAAADVAADAYSYFTQLFAVEPDIGVIVAREADWESRQPYGLPFFNDNEGQIRAGLVGVPAGSGDFWAGMGQDIRDASPRGYARLLAAYPGGADGLDLQPFFDLVTIHELGHAFEVLGDLRAARLLAGRGLRRPGAPHVRRNQAAGKPEHAGGALQRGSAQPAPRRPVARRGLQHAGGAREAHYTAGGDQPMQAR